jgi:hypothetical protein
MVHNKVVSEADLDDIRAALDKNQLPLMCGRSALVSSLAFLPSCFRYFVISFLLF